MEGGLLSRLHEQRSAARAERRGVREGRRRLDQGEPREPEVEGREGLLSPGRGRAALFAAGLILVATGAGAGPAREAVVTAQLGGAVEIVDLAAGKVVRSIPVDGAPAGIALSPDRKRAYVTRPEGHGLAVIDLDAGRIASEVALPGG